jgi:hypothetical protein
MQAPLSSVDLLESALAEVTWESLVPPNTDAELVEADLRAHLCEPFEVSAGVQPPGFPFADVGEQLVGVCVARREGYWLVCQPAEQRFLCFWGESVSNLGAHGVYGHPLYCWSA